MDSTTSLPPYIIWTYYPGEIYFQIKSNQKKTISRGGIVTDSETMEDLGTKVTVEAKRGKCDRKYFNKKTPTMEVLYQERLVQGRHGTSESTRWGTSWGNKGI